MSKRQYAKGRNAVAECQRSGQKMMYRDLVVDGHIPGLLVHPDWWEPKHPQEIPVEVTDPIALYRPAPEISIEDGYGNPEQPAPMPTAPTSNDLVTTSATAMTAGVTHVALEEPLPYIIGQWVFIQLDGGGYFISRITSTADTPEFRVPFSTPFAGVAAQGNQVAIGTGYALATTTFACTLGQFAADPNRIGCQDVAVDPTPVGGISPTPALLTAQDGLLTGIIEMADYPPTGTFPTGGLEIFFGTSAPGTDALAFLGFETYSTIELDHAGGTLSLDTRDIGSGGDMDQGGSFEFVGGSTFWFPNATKIWFDADIGQVYDVRFIP